MTLALSEISFGINLLVSVIVYVFFRVLSSVLVFPPMCGFIFQFI